MKIYLKLFFLSACLSFITGCETVKKTYSVITDPDAKVITDPKIRIVDDPKARIVDDPKVRIGSRLEQPSEYSVSIYATGRININEHSENTIDEYIYTEEFSDISTNDTTIYKNANDDQDFIDQESIAETTHDNSKNYQVNEEDKTIILEEAESSSQATPVKLKLVELSEKSLFLSATYEELLDDSMEQTLGSNYLGHEDLMIDPNQFRFFENKTMKKGTRYVGVIAYFSNETTKQWRDVVKVRSNGETYPLLVRVSEKQVNIYKDN